MQNLEKYHYFLVIDLEATCSDLKEIPRHEMETIEIGAVMVESTSLQPLAEWQTFIQPVRHPVLTQYCRDLTSITQKQVNQAPLYPDAIALFQHWLANYDNYIFGSWGNFDCKQLVKDSKYHSLPYPLDCNHLNCKKLFAQNQVIHRNYGLKQALELAKIELTGTQHRGIDDARNLAQLLPYVLGRKQLIRLH